jgi:maltooligosyltrehalose trehalohydrolase
MERKRATRTTIDPERSTRRQFPIGAEVSERGVHFRVYAPACKSVSVVIGADALEVVPLQRTSDGYFEVETPGARTGSLYRFQLDDDQQLYPDPASRFQPDGPHGPSQVVDPRPFPWTDQNWCGLKSRGQVLYELHIGTFTPEGTWAAAAEHLADLADVGITAIEVLPVSDFTGKFGWGYDGVNFFAPSRLYGSPDDFRRFVDRAHALRVGVILDVVYNHFGPDGNYGPRFYPHLFSPHYGNEWGEALNFDDEGSQAVREFVCANAAYWIEEFHVDGLRLDATQAIHDTTTPHVLAEIVRTARAAAGQRSIYIVGENEPQRIEHVLPIDAGGYGLNALWNDDLHHTAHVALLGRAEAYYADFRGAPQEFISAAKRGYLYQGQYYAWQKNRRGTPSLRIPPECFVNFLENHDQVANTAAGQRLHQLTTPGACRAMTAYLLLGPATPMLFQGQEFASSKPFLFFADLPGELAAGVHQGRKDFLKQFPSLAVAEMQQNVRAPHDPATFTDCQLDWSERERNTHAVALHRDLISLRRTDAVLAGDACEVDGAVLGSGAFLLRYFSNDGADRLLLINLDCDLTLLPAPEPLLSEPQDHDWQLAFSSNDPLYGGSGTPEFDWNASPLLPGNCALFFTARRRSGP